MGMESLELLAAHHHQAQQQQQQQQQRQLLTAGDHSSGTTGSMLSTTAQPTGGGLTQPLQQSQPGQSQDPLQSMVQQLVCLTQLQQLQFLLTQSGHM